MIDRDNWNALRLATVITAGAAGVGAVLLPPAAWILVPIATGLAGVAFPTPGIVARLRGLLGGGPDASEAPTPPPVPRGR